MKVFKFGGASVATADRIESVAKIIQDVEKKPLVVVISAMGKTTNALEALLADSRLSEDFDEKFNELVNGNREIIKDLFDDEKNLGFLDSTFSELYGKLEEYRKRDYDFSYDQIVSFGEIISTKIVHHYLQFKGISAKWLDARKLIKTDNTYREAKVDWDVTCDLLNGEIGSQGENDVFVTQGFIGSNEKGLTTTLGREGSDFSAAIISYCLDAELMAIWKDVPGILTADPRLFENVAKIDRLSYKEAIEMTYYGAKVIHPKTIKPLQNKSIPLWVKPFKDPYGLGTLISGEIELTYPPMIVIEPNQALIHISTKDFSFVGEDHLSKLFELFNRFRVRVNMMRNTAISFTVCTYNIQDRINTLIEALQDEFKIVVDYNLELITVRHYTDDLIYKLKSGKIILFEERLRNTIQIVVKDVPDMIRK